MAYERYDRQNTGFVVCMWLLALLALFGVEIRHCLYKDGMLELAVLYAAGFTTVVFALRRWLIWRELHHPTVWIENRRYRTALRDAHPEVRDYVNERARRLGVDAVIDVKILPRTFNLVDGFIVGDRDEYTMVLTAGTAALFLVPDEPRKARFQALVDHEIGHVAAGDVHMLYLARAIWWALLFGGPIKLMLLLSTGWSEPLEAFRIMLPRVANAMLAFMPDHELADITVAVAITTYWLAALMVLDSFYGLIVRRREFMADAFAYEHGGNEAGRKHIEDLLRGQKLAKSPPQAFGGSGRWHPKLEDRIEELGHKRVAGMPHGVAAVLVFVTLISTRLVLGQNVMMLEMPDVPYVTRPLSASFVLLFGYVLSCMVFPIRESNAASAWPWKNLLRLLLWSVIFTLSLSAAYAVMVEFPDIQDPHEPLMRLEVLEQQCMFWSVPLCILFIGIGMMLVMHVLKAGRGEVQSHFAAVVFGSALGIGMLFVTSKVGELVLAQHRDERIAQFRSEVLTAAQTKSWAEAASWVQPSQASPTSEPLELSEVTIARLMLLKKIEATSRDHTFLPPFSFFALWHGVFNAMGE